MNEESEGKERSLETIVKKIGLFVLALFGLMATWSLVGRMVSAASDVTVAMGILLLLAGACGIFWSIRKALSLCLLVGLCVYGQGCAKVEPGYVGIRVNMYGSQRGVEDFPIVTGRVWFNPWTEDIHKFPTFMQSVVWTRELTEQSPNDDSVTFNSIEGAVVNADIALAYTFVPEKVPSIFIEFRQDASALTWGYMRSQVRDAFSRHASRMKVVDIFGEKKQELLVAVKEDLNNTIGPKGFIFDMISFVGGLRVENRVAASINAVIEATQKAIEAENKVRQSRAEAEQSVASAEGQARAILAVAEAQAKSNRIVAESLTSELINWQALQKWNGTLPHVTGGAIPFVSIQ